MNEAAEQTEPPHPHKTMLARDKYWEECSPEQQIDRLRDTVARLCRDVTTLAVNLQQVIAHRHGANGELLTPFRAVDPNANYAQGQLGGGLYAHDNGIPHNLRREHERRDR